MARGTPMFFHGAIPKASTLAYLRETWLQRLIDIITSYQSNGEQAWEEADVLIATPSSYDAVYHSVGDRSLGSGSNKGDADIWMRLKQVAAARLKISFLLDYSPTSSSGKWERSVSTSYYLSDIVNINYPIEYWVAINEYEIIIVHRKLGDGVEYLELGMFGQLVRPYAEQANGIARLTSQSGTGNGVVIGLDRDISGNITVGQYVWLVQQTPDGQAFIDVNPDESCKVVAVSANSITLDGVVSTFSVGSLVGLDPSPLYSCAAAGRVPTRSQIQCVMDLWGGTSAWYGGPYQTMVDCQPLDADPDANGLFPLGQLWVRDGPSVRRCFRGTFGLVRVISKAGATPVVGDVIEADWDSAQRYKFFKGASYYDPQISGDWTVCIGPGATEL